MNRPCFNRKLLPLAFCVVIAGAAVAAQPNPRPNIVILLADDLGYGDLSIHGGETPTPQIDSLFRQGMELDNFKTWAVCSPSRAGLLTGINPIRIGQGPLVDGTLDPDITTFGKAFQQHGYRTGIFGKWHNSNWPNYRRDPGSPPVNAYGFDRWVGFYGGGQDFFTRVHCWEPDRPQWWHDDQYVPDEPGYTTDLITDHAIGFMEKNLAQNFVCYVPFSAVHNPYHAKEEDLQRVPRSIVERDGGTLVGWKEYYKRVNDALYPAMNDAYMDITGDRSLERISGKLSTAGHVVARSAMLINLDDNVGRILDFLEANDLFENTVVWFFSDNGALHQFGDNGPFRGGKHSMLEGGIRSPAMVHWPSGGFSGGRVYDGLMGNLDVYPTSMAMAGLPMPSTGIALDGADCRAAMEANLPSPVDAYYFLWADRDSIATS
ncbi:MAG: sulfatase-like hydrolase/transferase, partial [Verrucomicrobiota bacterium]|nr:sulfatase-like hydrolase/transferase [Verrucomicrobiota bacterium]